jgi:4-carboxymuconolactone decarboxylase
MTREPHNPATRAAGWTRVDFPAPERMSPAARQIYDSSVAYFGGPYGPRLPLLLTPDLHEPWAALGERLTAGALPPRLRELAILVTAWFWGADFVWLAHQEAALQAGLTRGALARLRVGATPDEAAEDERAVRDFCVRLLEDHQVSEEEFARVRDSIGPAAQVELTVLLGHYSGVALMLAAHAAPLPDGVEAPLSRARRGRAGDQPTTAEQPTRRIP